MQELVFTSGMYRTNTRSVRISVNAMVNTAVPSTLSYTSGDSAKVSILAQTLSRIFQDNVAIAISGDKNSVYCEYTSQTTGMVEAMFFANDQLYFTRNNEHRRNLYLPILIHHIINDPSSKVMIALRAAYDEFQTNQDVFVATIAGFCDCCYHEMKRNYPAKIKTFEWTEAEAVPVIAQLRQAARTNAYSVPDNQFCFPISSNFTKIEFTGGSASTGIQVPLNSDWYEECINGSHRISFAWKKNQYEKIYSTDFLNEYIPDGDTELLTRLCEFDLNTVIERLKMYEGTEAIKDNFINLLFVGDPGLGKTVTAQALSAILGLPLYIVSTTKNTEEDLYQGMNKYQGGNSFQFVSTEFLEAYTNGGIAVLEEINLGDPAVLQGALGQALVPPFVLHRDGYQPVERHPLFIAIATMNPNVEGGQLPNQAFTSRLPYTIMFEDKPDDNAIALLMSKGYEKTNCEEVYEAYKKLRKYVKEEYGPDALMSVTMRHCFAALKIMKLGYSKEIALAKTLGASIGVLGTDIHAEVKKAVFENLANAA